MQNQLAIALAHHRAGRLEEAEVVYRQMLADNPDQVDALHLLGVVCQQTNRCADAVELIRRAIGKRRDVPAMHNNLGEAHRKLGQYAEAVAAYQRALALDGRFAEAHNNLGTIHHDEGRLNEALACYDRAMDCRPEYANAHYNRARVWLGQGDFQRGWTEYEWRWRRAEFRRPMVVQPEWDGSPLAGRRLLVRAEQGLGDTLQFIRFPLELRADRWNAAYAIEVQSELIEFFQQSGITRLMPQGARFNDFEVHISLLSLPRVLGTRLDTIPARVPYLSADAGRIDAWRPKLAHLSGTKVGVAWQGNSKCPLEPWRSLPLAALEPLAAVSGVHLVSLQKGFGSEQVAALEGRFSVLDLSHDLDVRGGAFVDTAAVIMHLDLVITSDSAIAHLAGALGKPVWVMLSVSADWRWLVDRTDSPWYPTMRLFRQSRLGDWSNVVNDVADELARLVSRTSRTD